MTPTAAPAPVTGTDEREDRFLDAGGVPLRYVEQGRGEPVVLVHCFTGTFETQFVATGVFDGLAADHRTIGFDLRGHGRSGKPHDPAQYGAEMALDVLRLLDHLGIAQAHVVGYSLGAHLVALLMVRHPERLLTATLGGSTGRRHWGPAEDARAALEADELEQGHVHSQIVRLWPHDRPPPTPEEVHAQSERVLAGQDPQALAAIRRSNRAQQVSEAELAAVRIPVLGVVGTRDPYLADFLTLRVLIPALTLVTVDRATHGSAASRPEFLAAIRAFLAAHPASGAPSRTR